LRRNNGGVGETYLNMSRQLREWISAIEAIGDTRLRVTPHDPIGQRFLLTQGVRGEYRFCITLHLRPKEAFTWQLRTAILLLRLLSGDTAGRPVEYITSVDHPQRVVFKTPKEEMTW
jgi:hypothetical protein